MRRTPVVCFAVNAPGDIRGAVGPTGPAVGYRTTACAPAGTPCVNIKDAPSVWKYRPTSFNAALGDVDLPIYRYAEALLDYAEAQNELGNTAEAVRAVNQVRARARRGTGSETRAEPADLPPTLSKSDAREAIYMERNWELAFEQKRWFDFVRRDGIEPGYFVSQLQAHDPHASQRGRLSPQRKLFPVPQTEIDAMPTLTQNPGY